MLVATIGNSSVVSPMPSCPAFDTRKELKSAFIALV
jgi:hypothetical protein